MMHHLIESGCLNSTFWFVLAIALALLLQRRWERHRLLSVVIALLLSIGTLANLGLALYRAYTVPRDVLQDIVSAQEYLEGRPLYPSDMTARINGALEREGPRPSLLERWPELRKREQEHLRDALTSHWVQAHPPFMTLFTAPFVKYFGILGTQIAFVLIALLGFSLTIWMIRRELFPTLPRLTTFIIVVALLGWDPILTILRAGQSEMLLGCLLTTSWFLLRHERPGAAGIAAGVAICLKLIPGLILVVLLMRHRRAFVSALGTIATIALFSLAMTSWSDHVDYYHTSRGVVDQYAAYSGNISLLGTLARSTRDLSFTLDMARGLWLVCGGLIVLAFAWRMRWPTTGPTNFDLDFALSMTLMPLLSPVSWDHYFGFLILPLGVLASKMTPRNSWPSYFGLWLLFAVPQTTYDWLFALCNEAGLRDVGLWFVLSVRMACLGALVMFLKRTSRSDVP